MRSVLVCCQSVWMPRMSDCLLVGRVARVGASRWFAGWWSSSREQDVRVDDGRSRGPFSGQFANQYGGRPWLAQERYRSPSPRRLVRSLANTLDPRTGCQRQDRASDTRRQTARFSFLVRTLFPFTPSRAACACAKVSRGGRLTPLATYPAPSRRTP